MRRSAWWVTFFVAAGGVGCQGPERHDTDVPLVMEFTPPPNEERYNNAPEQGYRKPAVKQEFKPGFGAPGAGGAMGGGGPMR
jgi:hypothetical protein